jgi:predicted GIY-YIG superfamily endonuclease
MITYIIKCRNTGELYCGKTLDIKKRLKEHKRGINGLWFSSKRRRFSDIVTIKGDFEKRIKKFGVKQFLECVDNIYFEGEERVSPLLEADNDA